MKTTIFIYRLNRWCKHKDNEDNAINRLSNWTRVRLFHYVMSKDLFAIALYAAVEWKWLVIRISLSALGIIMVCTLILPFGNEILLPTARQFQVISFHTEGKDLYMIHVRMISFLLLWTMIGFGFHRYRYWPILSAAFNLQRHEEFRSWTQKMS
jgi:hypothetical protein